MTRNEFYAICTEATVNPFLVLEEDCEAKEILVKAKQAPADEQQAFKDELLKHLAENY